MATAFPGMDPYIEGQEWEDFHTRFNTVAGELLAPSLEPRYIVRVERRIYVEHAGDPFGHVRRADIAVVSTGVPPVGPRASSSAAVAPVDCVLPMPVERRESFLVIRARGSMRIVTILETLSPSNKTAGSPGRELYLAKRDEVLQSRCHLVEIDLLRGGLRLPTVSPLPSGDYYVLVSRRRRRPRAEAYAWTVRDPMPSIPVPLEDGEPDVVLDLQEAFVSVYSRARYHLSLDYEGVLDPPLSEADATWSRALLAGRAR